MARQRSFRQSGPRRKFRWEGAGIEGAFPGLASDAVIAFWARVPGSVLNTINLPEQVMPSDDTLTRTRCLVTCSTSNGGAQTSAPFVVSFGLIAWDGLTDDATDLGNNVPNPVFDLAQDWIWRATYPAVFTNHIILQNGGNPDDYQSLAQRKLGTGTGILFCAGFSSVAGAPASLDIYLSAEMRFLIRQH